MTTHGEAKASPPALGQAVSRDLHHDIERHYYREARLLQNGEYREWLSACVASDIHYWMPVYEQRLRRDKRPEPTPEDAAIYNDDYEYLKLRVERLYTGQVWMEDPPSRIRYVITNVEAYHADVADEFDVYSNFVVYRHRRQNERAVHTGGREDRLRRDGDGFLVARRKIVLDARVVDDKNMYFFV